MEQSLELLEIEKDSGMESINSSKDETPERKTVSDYKMFMLFIDCVKLTSYFFITFKEGTIEDYEDVSEQIVERKLCMNQSSRFRNPMKVSANDYGA